MAYTPKAIRQKGRRLMRENSSMWQRRKDGEFISKKSRKTLRLLYTAYMARIFSPWVE